MTRQDEIDFVEQMPLQFRRATRRQVDHLQGDEIATAGGLLGKVTKLTDATLSIEIAAGVEVQVQRSAVVQVLPKGTVK